jgi:lipopolysaccharide transport system permease protein
MSIQTTNKLEKDNWSIEIKPKKKLLDVDLKDIWRYRDLYYMYVKRDIITVYKQTILGPLWFLIQPILTTIMYMFVFGGLAGISTDGIPQPLFYMSGILLWNYFNAAFMVSSNVFTANASVFGKVYFPRLVVPLSGITSNLIKFGIQLILFIAIYLYYYIQGVNLTINWTIILFPILILMIALHAMSWGLIISALTTKYRDLTQLVTFGIQLFMYVTPVIYPLSAAPEKYRMLISFNPLTSIFETFKYSCMGSGSLDWIGLGYSFIVLLITLFLSIIIFNRVERNFMDTV